MLYIDGLGEYPVGDYQETLTFADADLAQRYEDLRPKKPVSLITIGCPQASVGELRSVAKLLKGKSVTADPVEPGNAPPIWVFTSANNMAIAEKTGIADIIRDAGALLVENTCPEVVPYDQSWVKHILTNSMKAEHYIKSGLNGIPTAVMTLADCVALACGETKIEERAVSSQQSAVSQKKEKQVTLSPGHPVTSSSLQDFTANGKGLPSQGDFVVTGEAFVTDTPITLLGFVNRVTGEIEEPGHPADGQSMAGKIAIFPKGSGSTVAPYVLLELFYRGNAPIAIANTEIDQQSAPACSLEGIPYAYNFDGDIIQNIKSGDTVELKREGDILTIRIVS